MNVNQHEMEYQGRLFGKVNKKFIELIATTDDIKNLKSDLYHAEANLEIANKQIAEMKDLLKHVDEYCYLGDNDLTESIKQAIK